MASPDHIKYNGAAARGHCKVSLVGVVIALQGNFAVNRFLTISQCDIHGHLVIHQMAHDVGNRVAGVQATGV